MSGLLTDYGGLSEFLRIEIRLTDIVITIVVFYIAKYFYLKSRKKIIPPSSQIVTEQIRQKVYKQKELVDSVISANDEEGYKIAEDLHDEVGPNLTALKQYIHAVAIKLDHNDIDKAKELLSESAKILKDAIQSVRMVSYRLSPTYMEKQGLFSALQEHIDKLNKVSDQEISFTYPNDINPEKEIAVNLYKIVLELINNSLKHSGGTSISVDFIKHENVLELNYKDNGCGFNEDEVFKSISLKQGLGLNNIQSRVNYINGVLINNSKRNKGVDYRIKIILIEYEEND